MRHLGAQELLPPGRRRLSHRASRTGDAARTGGREAPEPLPSREARAPARGRPGRGEPAASPRAASPRGRPARKSVHAQAHGLRADEPGRERNDPRQRRAVLPPAASVARPGGHPRGALPVPARPSEHLQRDRRARPRRVGDPPRAADQHRDRGLPPRALRPGPLRGLPGAPAGRSAHGPGSSRRSTPCGPARTRSSTTCPTTTWCHWNEACRAKAWSPATTRDSAARS